MARLHWRAATLTIALLAVTIGGASHGKNEAQLGQRLQPQAQGSEAKTNRTGIWPKGRAPYEQGVAGRSAGGLRGSGSGDMETKSGSLQERLGSGKVDNKGGYSRAGRTATPAETDADRGGLSGPVDGDLYGPNPGADYRGHYTITAYTAGYESTQKRKGQKGYGITFSGTTVQEGRTIAADLNVLPVGTRVYIEDVGERTVEDKGGAVKGKHIDLYIADLQQAKAWGKQTKSVYVIEWGKPKT